MNQRQPQGDRECRWIALKDVLSKTSSACGTSGSRELCRGGVPHERHACRLMGLDDRRITIGREKRISGAREKLEIFLLGRGCVSFVLVTEFSQNRIGRSRRLTRSKICDQDAVSQTEGQTAHRMPSA